MSRVFLPILWLSLLVSAQVPAKVARPNPRITPGVAGKMTKAQLCDPKFRTGTVRHVTETEKHQTCAAYGLKPNECPTKIIHGKRVHTWEIDHDIPLLLGGLNVPENRWAEPWAEARTKDKLEVRLKKLVCSNQIELRAAQVCISHDWVNCYQQTMALDVKRK